MDISGIANLIGSGSAAASSLFGMFGGGNDEQSKITKKMLKMMTAGVDDGNGNNVYYDKKSNTWKTNLNPVNKQMAGASDLEGLMRMLVELPRERSERHNNYLGRSGDRSIADTLRSNIVSQMNNPMTPERLEGDLYSSQARGINDAYDKVRSDVASTGLRTHASGDSAITNLAQTLAKNLGDARVSARLGGIQGADDIQSGKMNNLLQQFGAENASANNIDDIPYNPFQLPTQMASLASTQKGQAPQLGYMALSGSKLKQTNMQDNIFDFGQNLGLLMNSFKKPQDPNGNSVTSGGGGSTGLGNSSYRIGNVGASGMFGHI
jgi:hypothetical protein